MNKKLFLKSAAMTAAALPLVGCSDKDNRPNIIFFLLDDYGWADSSVEYGDEAYPRNQQFDTPNMQKLADDGVMMTNAYVCSVSTPTRTSIMTGMHAAHEHITSFTAPLPNIPTDGAAGGKLATIYENLTYPFTHGEWNWNGLSPVEGVNNTQYCTPMVQILRDNGYYTLHVGKAHWGCAGCPAANPTNLGFLFAICGNSIGHPGSYQSEDNYGNTPEKWSYAAVQDLVQYYGTGTHLTAAITKEALKAMEYPISEGKPFYLNLGHFATHTPIQADKRYYQKYLDRGLDEGEAKFASMVEGADESLGIVREFLEEKGIADNTVIIFMSDNGGHSVDYSKGTEPHRQNLPLREGKGSVYEGGIHVPMMVLWPGKTAAGTRVTTPTISQDLFPTILEIAGINDYETVQEVDGKSLVNLFTKGSQYVKKAMDEGRIADRKAANRFVIPEEITGIAYDRPIISHYPHQWRVENQYDIDFLSAIREGDWKLVYRMLPGELELYNLSEDIAEQNNVAAEHPELVEKLRKDLSDQLRAWDATMPIYRATGEPAPMPDQL